MAKESGRQEGKTFSKKKKKERWNKLAENEIKRKVFNWFAAKFKVSDKKKKKKTHQLI